MNQLDEADLSDQWRVEEDGRALTHFAHEVLPEPPEPSSEARKEIALIRAAVIAEFHAFLAFHSGIEAFHEPRARQTCLLSLTATGVEG